MDINSIMFKNIVLEVYTDAHHGEPRFQNLSNAMIAFTNDRNAFNTVLNKSSLCWLN